MNNWKKRIVLTLTLVMNVTLASTGAAWADEMTPWTLPPEETGRIDAAVQKFIASGVPGISIAVVRDGRVVYAQGYGVMDLKRPRPVTATTRMEIGSVTKQFTAAAVLQLVEQRKLSLDDSLGKYIPEYRQGRSIAIRELLWQISGVPDYIVNSPPEAQAKSVRGKPSVKRVLDRIAAKKLDFPTGSKWAYSNANYFLLGLVIERVSGIPFDRYVKENILDRAGMSRTTTIAEEAKLDDFATGYMTVHGLRTESPHFGNLWAFAAGDIVSDVGDMAKWNTALLAGKILSTDDVALMMTPGRTSDGKATFYAMGWAVSAFDGHKMIWHNGGTNGFGCMNALFPDDHLQVIALLNDSGRTPNAITGAVFEALYPEAAAAKYQPAEGENSAITAQVRDVIGKFQAGSLGPDDIADPVKHKPMSLNRQLKAMLAPLGPIEAVVFKGSGGEVIPNGYRYLLHFKTDDLFLTLSFDPTGKLDRLALGGE
jgi:CubicO group peptidase (beta-lactamase class C family)